MAISLEHTANQIKQAIDNYTATAYSKGFRWHLGASKIGEECKRMLWYHFRWVDIENADGRMQRLFNRGHLEENRHFEWLRGIGCQVWTHDESITREDGTHPQLRIKNSCNGHFGGSLDAIAKLPINYGINFPFLVSCKTSGTGASFNKVKTEHIAKSKPDHFIQESIYGRHYDIDHALYICGNKNDDDLAIQFVKLDFKLAEQMEVKAESIINSQTPPERISPNPEFFKCKNLCAYRDVCHHNKQPVKNCRSCSKARAVEGGEFFCDQWNGVIPRDVVKTGCDSWISIAVFEPPTSKTSKKKIDIVQTGPHAFVIKEGQVPLE